MTNNTIPNVPRELLADLLGNDHDKRIMAERHLLAMLANAPSPAGVDGDFGWLLNLDLPEAQCNCQWNPDSHDKTCPVYLRDRLSDAQAIIDGLRGEVERLQRAEKNDAIAYKAAIERQGELRTERDQQAQRIGELERALLKVAASLAWNAHGECRAIHDGPIMPSKMAIDAAKAALSAGKDSDQ